MNKNAKNNYTSQSRYAKGFEIIVDGGVRRQSYFNIPKEEAERVFGTKGTVPEGTIVRKYPVGTAIGSTGYTTVAGDLKICENEYEEPWGITTQKVKDFPNNYRENELNNAVSYGERVTVARGDFDGLAQNFNRNGTTTFNPGTLLYCGGSGQVTVDDGTLNANTSGYVVGEINEQGFVGTDVRTGSTLAATSGGIPEEIYASFFFTKQHPNT